MAPNKRIEYSPLINILFSVKVFSRALVIAVLVLFGLASVHCRLEVLPGFSFLQGCCSEQGTRSAPSDCGSDECSIEQGGYRLEESAPICPLPVLGPAVGTLAWAQVPEPLTPALARIESVAPPELFTSWRFSRRVALSPRAPSFLS
jgi:hypothetical protein